MSHELEIVGAPDHVHFDGEPLPGSNRVRRFVALLLAKPGEIVSLPVIQEAMDWTNGQSGSNNAKVAACHAREVFAAWRVPAVIETAYGRGYRLRLLS